MMQQFSTSHPSGPDAQPDIAAGENGRIGSDTLTALVRQKALALGFDKVGIVAAAPVDAGTAGHLREWLALGYHADMQWMVAHLDKRLDPAALLPGAKSLVCVAMNYYTPDEYDSADPAALKLAKYARGTDYHVVLKDRLKRLLLEIQAVAPGVNGRALTDSAPILEKPLAVKAGLGWLGRNGNVITPDLGSWLFLGELLLDVELVPDIHTVPDHCGTCRRCIDACPTGAIISDGVIDANRCISYWTIENKGDVFPDAITQNLNGWIFGCDICQDVCPWNLKFARPTAEPEFQPRPLNRNPDAQMILALDDEQFRLHFRKSPVKRAKLSGLKRNIHAAQEHSPTIPDS